MTYVGSDLEFWCGGEISIRERGEESGDNTYPNSVTLVDQWRKRIGINMGIGEEDEQFRIRIGDYHIQGYKQEQAFHVNVEIRFDRSDMARLHAYLAFLLTHGDLDRTLPDDTQPR